MAVEERGGGFPAGFWQAVAACGLYFALAALVWVALIPPGSLLGALFSLVVVWPLPVLMAAQWATSESVPARGRSGVVWVFGGGVRVLPRGAAGMFVTSVLVCAGLVLFLVPGVIAMIRLSLVPVVATAEGTGPWVSVVRSWNVSRGRAAEIASLLALGFCWSMAAAVLGAAVGDGFGRAAAVAIQTPAVAMLVPWFLYRMTLVYRDALMRIDDRDAD